MRERIIGAFPGPGLTAAPVEDALPSAQDGTPLNPGKPLIAAAVLIPLIERPEGMTVLLTQRTAHLNAHAGQVSFPGGRVEPHDKSPEATALRETEEEVGLHSGKVELVGRMNVRETGTGYRVVPVVGLVRPPFLLTPDPIEVAEIFEVPLDHVLDPANHQFETRVHNGIERQFYVLPFEDYYIWGLTARLLVNLSVVLGRS